jgi:hypothetical protein
MCARFLSESINRNFKKMVRSFLYILLFTTIISPKARSAERVQLSLITCSSGEELYSIFGHSALRVYYPDSGRDLVFNFGLFDFNTPNFYIKFIKGQLKYMLGIQYMPDFMAQYEWEKRGVREQVLNITPQQTKAVMDRLEYLYRPENRYYLYSFLYKNCTSELRDIIVPLTGQDGELRKVPSGVTDRELINRYINGWTKFGISLILGSTLDREVDLYQTMFLPENLYGITADLKNGDEDFVKEDIILLKENTRERAKRSVLKFILSPISIFSLLLAGMLFVFFKRKSSGLFDNLFLCSVGLLGSVMLIIIMITEHRELFSNYNLLWSNPFYLLVVLASVKKWKKTERLLSAISLVFLAILQIIWSQGVQYAEPGFILIALALALSFVGRIVPAAGKNL